MQDGYHSSAELGGRLGFTLWFSL